MNICVLGVINFHIDILFAIKINRIEKSFAVVIISVLLFSSMFISIACDVIIVIDYAGVTTVNIKTVWVLTNKWIYTSEISLQSIVTSLPTNFKWHIYWILKRRSQHNRAQFCVITVLVSSQSYLLVHKCISWMNLLVCCYASVHHAHCYNPSIKPHAKTKPY